MKLSMIRGLVFSALVFVFWIMGLTSCTEETCIKPDKECDPDAGLPCCYDNYSCQANEKDEYRCLPVLSCIPIGGRCDTISPESKGCCDPGDCVDTIEGEERVKRCTLGSSSPDPCSGEKIACGSGCCDAGAYCRYSSSGYTCPAAPKPPAPNPTYCPNPNTPLYCPDFSCAKENHVCCERDTKGNPRACPVEKPICPPRDAMQCCPPDKPQLIAGSCYPAGYHQCGTNSTYCPAGYECGGSQGCRLPPI